MIRDDLSLLINAGGRARPAGRCTAVERLACSTPAVETPAEPRPTATTPPACRSSWPALPAMNPAGDRQGHRRTAFPDSAGAGRGWDVAPPGFINFRLRDQWLANQGRRDPARR